MTFANYQEQVDQWIKKYGVRYFDQLTNTVLLMEEVGELARIIARTQGEQSFKEKPSPSDIKNRLADEIMDILFVVTCLANQNDINITEEIERNFLKKSKRDSTRHLNNSKLN